RGLVRAIRVPLQRTQGVVPDHLAGPGEDAEVGPVPGEAPAAGGRRRIREDGGLPRRSPLLRDRGRRRSPVPGEDPQPRLLHDGRHATPAPGKQTRGRGVHPRLRRRVRRGDGQVSAPLIPDLFGICKVLVGAMIWVGRQLIYALAGPVPPMTGFGDWLGSDPVVTVATWFLLVTVVVMWVTVLNLFTVMWVERKWCIRLEDRYGIMISVWSLPFWPFNRTSRPTHKGMGYLQNLADGVKLIQKENITPRNADSAMFHISPVLIASST